MLRKSLKMVKQNSMGEHQFGREWMYKDEASLTRIALEF